MSKAPGEPIVRHEWFWASVTGLKPVAMIFMVVPSLVLIAGSVLALRHPVPPIKRFLAWIEDGVNEYIAAWHERRVYRMRYFLNKAEMAVKSHPDTLPHFQRCHHLIDGEEVEARELRAKAERVKQRLPWQRKGFLD